MGLGARGLSTALGWRLASLEMTGFVGTRHKLRGSLHGVALTWQAIILGL